MTALHELSIAQAGAAMRSRELSSRELTEHSLERISRFDAGLDAFVLVTGTRALEDAARADRERSAGIDRGPLHGIPYALKDIFDVEGIPTSCHSHLRQDHMAQADCRVQARLREGGAVLLGKLATHEFALGGPSWDLPYPPARNPWNRHCFTGASSSGSGAAVAAGFVRLALGTDTSGSIRNPATLCGAVGLKPTFGLVSIRGVFPLSYSLDHCGPLTATVEDAALSLEVLAEPRRCPEHSRSSGTTRPNGDLRTVRIGYPRHLFADAEHTAPEMVSSIDRAAEILRELGATVEEVSFPDYDQFDACGRIIMSAEGFAIHERDLIERPESYGRITYQRLAAGAGLTASDLIQACRLRRQLARELNHGLFARFDVLITASVLAPAPRFDAFPTSWPAPGALVATQTIPYNVSGNPALAVPTGLSVDGLPLGMQMVGRWHEEATLFRVAAAFEAGRAPWPRPALDPPPYARAVAAADCDDEVAG